MLENLEKMWKYLEESIDHPRVNKVASSLVWEIGDVAFN